MKILVNIGHPAHVHFFKNFIWEMEKKGHEIMITSIDKDIALDLLNLYGFKYEIIGKFENQIDKILGLITITYKLYKIAKKNDPDIFVSIGANYTSHVSVLLNKPNISFEDTEHCPIFLYKPFTDVICTPSCFKKDLGRKQIRYDGYHELAYLHPNYFTPNPAVLDEMGLSKDDTFIILRFVSWTASHDVGQHGIRNKIELVRELEKYWRVLITSEGQLPKELGKYKIKVSPDKLHDLLYYASLYVGEGATIATESAILGTPSIYVSSLVGTMGNFIELEQKYGLMLSYKNSDKAINDAVELIQKTDLKEEWRKKREKLLKDKIDVTAFMVWFAENYPESFREMKENPRVEERFK